MRGPTRICGRRPTTAIWRTSSRSKAILPSNCGQLEAKLSPSVKISHSKSARTEDLAAYDLYVEAKSLEEIPRVGPNLDEAARLLDQAVERDPNFFLAYCTLVRLHGWAYRVWDHTPARRALDGACLGCGHAVTTRCGRNASRTRGVLYRCEQDDDNARAEATLAQRALPSNARVFTLLSRIDYRQGRIADSIRNGEKAVELDPRNLQSLRSLSILPT